MATKMAKAREEAGAGGPEAKEEQEGAGRGAEHLNAALKEEDPVAETVHDGGDDIDEAAQGGGEEGGVAAHAELLETRKT